MPQSPDAPTENQIPLAVDLDGTLIKTDLLWESFVRLLKKNPLWIFPSLLWWIKGRAFLKQQIAARVTVDPAALPYCITFLEWLRAEKSAGRKIILATASDIQMAMPVAKHVGIFDEVLGSDGKKNLRSGNKLKALAEKFGERGFDYAGNSPADLAVWRGSREAVVVNASTALLKQAEVFTKIGKSFEPQAAVMPALLRSLRPHQWVKNLIVFVPAIAAHKLGEQSVMLREFYAFLIFCLCASGVYLVNDLMDLDADRQHPTKKIRPLASGDLPLQYGLIFGPLLLFAGLFAAIQLSWIFAGVTTAYLILTTTYSFWVKQIVLLDVFCLAGLYTIRLVAGHAAADIIYSSWLLMFSMFIFLSLALVKRYVEIADAKESPSDKSSVAGRGYLTNDKDLVASLGTGSGYLAALVLALYVNSQQVVILYAHPNLLLLICPLLLYWISRMWLLAHRGELQDDPVFFAIKDATSYIIGALALSVLWLAAGH
jgi:4-hydroxybenzoate polyprenyltransferase